jgi:succinate dehydrogenase flavin-adding protein (antitoxin of CptAB toxin-antitoxin module)
MIDSVKLYSSLVELCNTNENVLQQVLDEYVSSLNDTELRTLEKFIVMHDSTLDLFCQHEDENYADEYAMELERKAAELEITVDYYMMEFV